MKNIIECYAVIDYCYFVLRELSEEKLPKSPIVQMIDNASGFTKYKNKQLVETAISMVKYIIKYKRFVEADSTKDKQLLKELKDIKFDKL